MVLPRFPFATVRHDQRHTLRREGASVLILDQTRLPHESVTRRLTTLDETAEAISAMRVRGAPLIGATAAFGLALAMQQDSSDAFLEIALQQLAATRPTAVNLAWALARMAVTLKPLAAAARSAAAWREAQSIADEDAACNAAIGRRGLDALRGMAPRDRALRVMTHCNAGWLATVAWGTALAPVYAAHAAGLPIEVWVSETRPRNQGLLTAFELGQGGVRNTLIADNAAGHLIARGQVDVVIVGADRIAANGDTANKVGTYLKALAARAAGIPFWVAAPLSSVDPDCPDGLAIPIEERPGDELRCVGGLADGMPRSVALAGAAQQVCNPAFDVTPAALIDAVLCERGFVQAADVAALAQEMR